MPRSPGSTRFGVPAPALFVASGLTQYVGAALAVGLFPRLGAGPVAWLRVAVASVVLLAWARPWRRPWTRSDLLGAAAFGLVLAGMNVAFYLAIARLPLGTAVAIEFIGPVAVAAITGHGWRERAGIGLAACGVVLLAGVTLHSGGPDVAAGLVAISVAAALWAGYILLGRRVAHRGSGVAGLSVAMTAGALGLAPFFVSSAGVVLTDPRLAAAVVGVAVLSSVVPYAIEQVVLRRVSAATFAVLLATLPTTAVAVGAVVLRQWPHPVDLVGLALVSGAIALTTARPNVTDHGTTRAGGRPET
jgi:inner membrane transporter RhtA